MKLNEQLKILKNMTGSHCNKKTLETIWESVDLYILKNEFKPVCIDGTIVNKCICELFSNYYAPLFVLGQGVKEFTEKYPKESLGNKLHGYLRRMCDFLYGFEKGIELIRNIKVEHTVKYNDDPYKYVGEIIHYAFWNTGDNFDNLPLIQKLERVNQIIERAKKYYPKAYESFKKICFAAQREYEKGEIND